MAIFVPAPNIFAPIRAYSLLTTTQNIAVKNESVMIPDATIKQFMNAIQTQLNVDFLPSWGMNAQLTFYPGTIPPPSGHWRLVFTDLPGGGFGIHFPPNTPGNPLPSVPYAFVYVKTIKEAPGVGSLWPQLVSSTASHEVLEMLVDPLGTRWTASHFPPGNFVLMEVCDPVQDYLLVDPETDIVHLQLRGYIRSGTFGQVIVSNFVTPAWYNKNTGVGPFDRKKLVKQPMEILKGGFVSVLMQGFNLLPVNIIQILGPAVIP